MNNLKITDLMIVEPIVDDVLTHDQLRTIIYGEGCFEGAEVLKNSEFRHWDGSIHEGAAISVCTGDSNLRKYFFMERTYEKKYSSGGFVHVKQIWHKLIPILDQVQDELVRWHTITPKIHSNCNNVTAMCNAILQNVKYGDVTSGFRRIDELSLYDATKDCVFIDSPEEIEAFQKRKYEATIKLVNGLVPAGDKLWDDLLLGEMREIQSEVFKSINRRGHHIYVDGERDSFGLVSRGIVMDGKLMTSCYF